MSILGPSWKTTIGGILSAVGFAMRKHPATAPWSDLVQEVGIGIGLLAARDNNVTSEQAGAAKGPSIPVSVKMMILFLSVSLFSGCARFVGQTETRADGTSITRFLSPLGMHWQARRDWGVTPGALSSWSSSLSVLALQDSRPCRMTMWQVEQAQTPPQA